MKVKVLRIIVYTLLLLALFTLLFPLTDISTEVVSLFVLVAIALDFAFLAMFRVYRRHNKQ